MARDIDDLPKNLANYTALTPLWFLDRAATIHPTRSSLLHGSFRYTWLQTYKRCRQLASALTKHSVGIGSTVFPIPLSFVWSPTEPMIKESLILFCSSLWPTFFFFFFFQNLPRKKRKNVHFFSIPVKIYIISRRKSISLQVGIICFIIK